MAPPSLAALVNVVGFLLGTALYGLLLGTVLRTGAAAWPCEAAPRRRRGCSSLTGLLGLTWNLGSLWIQIVDPAAGAGHARHLRRRRRRARLPAGRGRALGAGAAAGRSDGPRAASRPGRARRGSPPPTRSAPPRRSCRPSPPARGAPLPAPAGLWLLTGGFVALVAALLVRAPAVTREGRPLWVLSLSIFAVSALHLGHHTGREAWPTELVGHHASLPLAVAILLRDYRFALADIFLKRALALTLVVVAVATAHVTVGSALAGPERRRRGHDLPARPGAGGGAAAGTGARVRRVGRRHRDAAPAGHVGSGARGRGRAGGDHRAGRHPGDRRGAPRRRARRRLDRSARDRRAPPPATSAARVLAGADAARFVAGTQTRRLDGGDPDAPPRAPLAAIVAVPTVDAPLHVWCVGPLTGGRRWLSDDVALAESVAFITARRLDALRVADERYAAALRERQIGQLATEAELRALRAQLNPHFLFNALTTIGYLIQVAPARAQSTLMRLTSLLRGVLRRSTTEFSRLGDEIALVQAYLEIEEARFEERLRVRIAVDAALHDVMIPSLLAAAAGRERGQARHRAARRRRRGRGAGRARRRCAPTATPCCASPCATPASATPRRRRSTRPARASGSPTSRSGCAPTSATRPSLTIEGAPGAGHDGAAGAAGARAARPTWRHRPPRRRLE